MEFQSKLNIRTVDYREFALPGILLGLLCTANGFMFKIGGFNLRISDIPFFFIPLYWILLKYNKHYYYSTSINKGIAIVFFLFLWLTISGYLNFSSFIDIYQDNFIKYYINKILWIPIYVCLYMIFGGKSFLNGVLYGISLCAIFNVFMILYEFLSIRNGNFPQYDFLSNFGLIVDRKKYMVINQDMIRPTGLMLDPNYTGGYTGIGIIYFDYLYRKFKKKKYIVLSILCIIPMLLVFSRTGLFSIFVTFCISFIIHLKNSRKYPILSPWMIITALIGIAVTLSVILSISDSAYDMLINRMSMKDSSASVRTQYIEYYFKLANPVQILFGVGAAGNFLINFWGMHAVWAPESSFITLFIEQGLIFFVLYIILLGHIFIRLTKSNYYFALIFLYINLIGLSYNFLGERVYFFLTVCMILFSYSNNLKRIKCSTPLFNKTN